MMNTIGGPGFRKALEDLKAIPNRNAIETSNRNAERIIAAINKNEKEPAKDLNRGKSLDIKA